jgi:hypothetical protein
MLSKPVNRARLDRVDRERAPVDPPARPRVQVFVVVAQMPHQIAGVPVGDRPMVSDARDAAQRVIGVVPGGIHLADDRVFGSADGGERSHRSADAVPAMVMAHRLECSGWVGQP